MPTKIGPFEILSELAKSPTGTVYKANDPESSQTIALKAIQLSVFADGADALEHALLAEAESTNILSSPNISKVFGAGEIDGQFCAAMEYVQGNSIATMLARKEGFSIWDLLDIGRQLCSGLDHAGSHRLVHYSLEPAKIMCGWDGTVKILSFGVSSVGNFTKHIANGVPLFLHYMSPEQVRGEAMDSRSNLYTLGAMFYEMVTERKAFDRQDAESLRQSILESTPVAPVRANAKVHPLLSDLIMKALEKDPAKRYQSGREMLEDLEKCKESRPAAAKKPEPAKGLTVPAGVKAAAQSKFVGVTGPTTPADPVAPQRPATAPLSQAASGLARPSVPNATTAPRATSPTVSAPRPLSLNKPSKLAMPKAAAAAAGVGSPEPGVAPSDGSVASPDVKELESPSELSSTEPAIDLQQEQPSAYMSAVAEEPQVETFEPEATSPKFAVDPMMAEGGPSGGTGSSFSDISELPPLKEIYVAPPPAPAAELASVPSESPAITPLRFPTKTQEKPKIQPREVAQKAITEIKGVPPKLYLYALGVAGALILAIGIGVTYYIHSQSDDDAGAPRSTAVTESPAPAQPTQPEPVQSAPQPDVTPAPAPAQPQEVQEPEQPEIERPATGRKSHASKRKGSVAPVVVPGQLAIDSTPAGAQVQIDGATDPSWVTPFTLTNLQPGQHTITVSKAGYATDTRAVTITAGNRASAQIHLAQLMATLVVKSDPPGASIYVDGRDMSAKTPAQVSVNKGQHLILVRLSGYLDETMSAQFALGQTFNFSPTLRPLGNADSIKTVGGKMSRLFGGKGGQPGQATLSIRTQPKGAQVAVNQRMLDKTSPVEVMLDPGNYEVDITLSGYAPIHKVINASKSGKVVLDEVLQAQ
jgi:serine/threonine protein kinase